MFTSSFSVSVFQSVQFGLHVRQSLLQILVRSGTGTTDTLDATGSWTLGVGETLAWTTAWVALLVALDTL